LREISDGGAVLVRPDNHIAYRVPGPVSDTRDALTRTISTLLGR
jgi:2,4-dichlorophenol 6-monooxygenase